MFTQTIPRIMSSLWENMDWYNSIYNGSNLNCLRRLNDVVFMGKCRQMEMEILVSDKHYGASCSTVENPIKTKFIDFYYQEYLQ